MLDIIFQYIGIGTVIYWLGVLGVKIIERAKVVYHSNNETVSKEDENEKEIKVVKKETKKKTVDKKENKTTTKKSTAKKPKTKEKE